jgi:4-amino-4-deoxy-L-arabinose transferase-like glycosyltransferase
MQQLDKVAPSAENREWLAPILLSLIGMSFHILWLSIDRSLPSWDQAAHLTNALIFQKIFDRPQLLSPDWWHELWAGSPSYRAPFIYWLTVPFLNIFGKSFNAGVAVNLLFIPIVTCTTYYLGRRVFDRTVGLWAAGMCLMFPALLSFQLDYLLDYGIIAITTLTFIVLTLWKDATTKLETWQWSLLFGILFGCLMLAKPTGFLFLLFPGLFLLGSFVKHRNWWGLLQSGIALAIAWGLCGGWYRQNWLTIITSAIAANGMGKGEGDPSGMTLEGWLYYIKKLPELISSPILIVTIGCILVWLFDRSKLRIKVDSSKINWLLIYFIGGYVLCSLATNKDCRFISPLYPILSIFIAASFNLFQTTWLGRLKWVAVGLNGLLLLIHILPIPGIDGVRSMTEFGYSYPRILQTQPELSSQQLIKEIITNQPYLRANIGSMVSSPEINFENLDFYGQANDFQVYAREFNNAGDKAKQQLIDRDIKAYNWYALKTGDIGKIDKKLLPIVERDPNLQLYKSWETRDRSILKLYRRKEIPILVEPIADPVKDVRLEKVIISPTSGDSIDTTYQLSGDRESLKNGILILTWQSNERNWYHDRGIGLGELYLDRTNISSFRITEHSAMLPPEKLPIETYQLSATYLNRQTGQALPLTVPKIEIRGTQTRSNQLDLITQLHRLSPSFARGQTDPVFGEIAIINQYDPIQDYLIQAQKAIEYRLTQGNTDLNLRYTLALTQALQRQIDPLLANLTQIVDRDSQNPAALTYLGVVRLYNWQPQAAETVFKKAEALPSPPQALQTLKIVSALFRFNLPQLWQRLHT